MIFDLRPPELTELGLAEAIRNYAAEWEARCGIKVASQLDLMDTGLPPMEELAVYRVMQEALQNVHKHAHASAVGLAWSRANENWVLHVTDDGTGFDLVKAARHEKSVGLLSMRERAELIGGSLQIQSAPGKGTAVTLLLPVEKKVEPLRARRNERAHKEQE
jgi:signal transduction histidine kinase